MKTEEINWLKKSLAQWNCIFCNILCDDKKIRGYELMSLNICGVCLERYKIVSSKNTTPRQKEIINKGFTHRCYFCEKKQTEPLESINGFNVCNNSCHQKCQVINDGKKEN